MNRVEIMVSGFSWYKLKIFVYSYLFVYHLGSSQFDRDLTIRLILSKYFYLKREDMLMFLNRKFRGKGEVEWVGGNEGRFF